MADWTSPASSFDNVTITALEPPLQEGAIVDLRRVLTDHAVQWSITHDSDDKWALTLRGSLDGNNWYDIGAGTAEQSGMGASGSITVLNVATLKPARYVRAAGYTPGGGTPIVTALVTARE